MRLAFSNPLDADVLTYSSVAEIIFITSSLLYGSVGRQRIFGARRCEVGFSLSHPRCKQNRKNARRRSNFFDDDSAPSFHPLRKSSSVSGRSWLSKLSPLRAANSISCFTNSSRYFRTVLDRSFWPSR